MKPAAFFVAVPACAAFGVFALLIQNARSAKPAPLPVLRWSNPHTWASGRVPRANEAVVLPEGRTVLLDVSPPPLRSVLVGGTNTALVFDDTQNRTLTAPQITVAGENAKLVVGTPTRPFAHTAILRLSVSGGDGKQTPMLSVSGANAQSELWGETERTAWTRLAGTAQAGTDTLTLAERKTHWRVGDTLVIAPTGYDAGEAETRTVASVAGATVRFSASLRFRHWGQITARGVCEQAEVGLLSRNIVVEGQKEVGGCVMVMGQGAGAKLLGAEFRYLGVEGEKGKYPIHFHRVGDGTGSFVRNCAIHDAYNRFVTIHGTRHVVVENNVGFNTIGHGFFLEDGDETSNTLQNNLGLRVRMPRAGKAVTPGDVRPSVFWITNPDNTVRGNVAAGSDYYGFWYDLPAHPTGAAASSPLQPRRTSLGLFAANTAHSCQHDGLFVDNAANPSGVIGAPTYDPPQPAFFSGFTAYKCRRRGVWLRGSRLFLTHATLADNGIGVTLAASASGISNALIVGETENTTGLFKPDEPTCPLVGYEFYDGPLRVENTTFADFVPQAKRPASALGVLRFSPFFVAPTNTVRGLRFENAARMTWERRPTPGSPDLSGDGYRTAIFTDGDGSVTGKAGAQVVAGEPFLYAGTDACVFRPDWNAGVCDGKTVHFARLFVDNRDVTAGEIGPVRFTPQTRLADFVRTWGVPREGANVSFQANVRTNEAYTVRYEGNAPPPHCARITLRDAFQTGDLVSVTLPVGSPQTSVSLWRVDAHKRRTSVPINGEVASRDKQTGDLTLRLTTPKAGEQVTIEVVQE